VRARPGFLNAGSAETKNQRVARDNFLFFLELQMMNREIDLAVFVRDL
jgi:hypothetical protein